MSGPFAPEPNWTPGSHVSASSLFAWDRCSAAWWFDRVMHMPGVDRSFFIIGGELHQIAELVLTCKRDKLPLPSMTEIADRIRLDLNVRFSVPGIKFSEGENAEICTEDAVAMAEVWMKEVQPKIEPLAIELKIGPEDGLRLPGSNTPVKAILDVIDQYAGIRDLKTAKAKWPEGAAERKIQTSVYSWAFRILYETPPAYVAYDLLVRKKRVKKRPTALAEYHEIKVVPNPALEFGVLRRMETVVAQMKAGHYFPNHSHECDDCAFLDFCTQHFTEQPFAPWVAQEATAQVTEGPKLIRRGGRNGSSVGSARDLVAGDGSEADRAAGDFHGNGAEARGGAVGTQPE